MAAKSVKMSVKNFKYKKDGVRTERRVLVIEDTDEFVAGIDFTHLSQKKTSSLNAMLKRNDVDTNAFMTAYRRFNRKNISCLKEETI